MTDPITQTFNVAYFNVLSDAELVEVVRSAVRAAEMMRLAAPDTIATVTLTATFEDMS